MGSSRVHGVCCHGLAGSRSVRDLAAYTGRLALPRGLIQNKGEQNPNCAEHPAKATLAVLMSPLGVFIRPHLPSASSPDTWSQHRLTLDFRWVRPWDKPTTSGLYLTSFPHRPALSRSISPSLLCPKNLIRPAAEPPGRTAGTRDRNSLA